MPRANAYRVKIEAPPVVVDPRPIREIELEALERFTGGKNPLGWKVFGRDEDGTAVIACETWGTHEGERVRLLNKVRITKEGYVHMKPEIIPDDDA